MITTYLRFNRKRIRLVFFYLLLFSTCLRFLYCLLSQHFHGQLLQHSWQSCQWRFLKPHWATNKLTWSWVLETAVSGIWNNWQLGYLERIGVIKCLSLLLKLGQDPDGYFFKFFTVITANILKSQHELWELYISPAYPRKRLLQPFSYR